eukprot:s491_g13.t1
MATWEPTAMAVASTGGHWWGPLDGPRPAGRLPAASEAQELRAQLSAVRQKIAARQKQLAMLPGAGQEEDGFIPCLGKTCFKGQDGETLQVDLSSALAQCKDRCRAAGHGAFVVTGDTVRFCPQKVGDCRVNLVDDPMCTTYLNSSPEAAQLCSDLRRLAQSRCQLTARGTGTRSGAAAVVPGTRALEDELRRKTQQSLELHRSVQALEEALQGQMEASDQRVEEILGALRAVSAQRSQQSMA